MAELHEHRLAVNHVVEINTPQRLQFAQYNNYRLAADAPGRNKKLVKRISSDRHGTLRMYYNTQNEIRNAAVAYSSQWANDTWMHCLLVQRFLDQPRRRFSPTRLLDGLPGVGAEGPVGLARTRTGGTPPDTILVFFSSPRPVRSPALGRSAAVGQRSVQLFRPHGPRTMGHGLLSRADSAAGKQLALGQRYPAARELKRRSARRLPPCGQGRWGLAFRLIPTSIGWCCSTSAGKGSATGSATASCRAYRSAASGPLPRVAPGVCHRLTMPQRPSNRFNRHATNGCGRRIRTLDFLRGWFTHYRNSFSATNRMNTRFQDVLIVDDAPTMRLLLSHILEGAGYAVRTAADGREALEAVQQQCPYYVITDWQMSPMDGIEFCRRLPRQDLPHYVYVMLLTAHAQGDDIVVGLNAGADDFIAKPVNKGELLARLQAGSRVLELEGRLSQLARCRLIHRRVEPPHLPRDFRSRVEPHPSLRPPHVLCDDRRRPFQTDQRHLWAFGRRQHADGVGPDHRVELPSLRLSVPLGR